MQRRWSRSWVAVFSASLLGISSASAQIPFAFKFKEGSPLVYQTSHVTKVDVVTPKESNSSVASVKQKKRWDVKKVDSLGVATLELTIEALAIEQSDPTGETIKYDSTDLPQSDSKLAEQLKNVTGRPIMQVDLDSDGTIKAYKHLTQRNDVLRELPFQVTVPADRLPTAGTTWRRDFPITIEPPLASPPRTLRGVQNCTVSESNSNKLVIDVECKLIDEVKEPKLMVPVVQFLPKGTVVLDPKAGRMVSAQMKTQEVVKNFQGEGSTYTFSSTYSEELLSVEQADKRQ
ncbi:hypothetical protein K2X85_19330 [bacterium]|jgi:hypothetical protein|nr:hypothetical protein [bacterium]